MRDTVTPVTYQQAHSAHSMLFDNTQKWFGYSGKEGWITEEAPMTPLSRFRHDLQPSTATTAFGGPKADPQDSLWDQLGISLTGKCGVNAVEEEQ
jgi:hypothetical protein